MNVLLRNNWRQPFIATMYHDIACRRAQRCLCKVTRGVSPAGKPVAVRWPASFQIDGKSIISVDEAALHLPQVKSALKSGWLSKEEQPKAMLPKRARASVIDAE